MKNKGLKIVLAFAVMTMLLTTGCLGGGDDEEGKGGDGGLGDVGQYVEMPGQAYDAEGWISSPDASEPVETQHEEIINVPGGNVVSFKVTCSAADSDAAHAETDDGSDPDTITFKISDGGNNTGTVEIQTDGTQNFVSQDIAFPSGNATGELMGGNWTILIKGKKFGSGKSAYLVPRPGAVIPSALMWIDQGAAWKIHVEYTYADFGGEETTEE